MRLIPIFQIILLFFFVYKSGLFAQSIEANFFIDTNACLNERLNIKNNALNAIQFEWDFCEGDLFTTPSASKIGFLSGAFNPRNMEVLNDGSNWFAFVVSTGTNSLYRLDFGASIKNPSPTIVNLGNIGNILSAPISIRVIQEKGEWIGFILNNSGPSLVRVNFGDELGNGFHSTENLVRNFSANNGLAIQNAGDENVLIATNINTNTLTLVDFGNSFLNSSGSLNFITTAPLPGAVELDDIKLFNFNGNWFGFTIAQNSRRILRLEFGLDLSSNPAVTDITGSLSLGGNFPSGITCQWDRGRFTSLIQTFSGELILADYGANLLNVNPVYSSLGNLNLLANSINLEFVKVNSEWIGFTLDFSSLEIKRINFQSPCIISLPSSSQFEPKNITCTDEGEVFVALAVNDRNKNFDYQSKSLIVSAKSSPEIDFDFQNICIVHPIDFQASALGLPNYLWSFGDSETSTDPNPTHQYNTAGEYIVSLQVTAQNGCNNYTEKSVTIYSPPAALFDSPTGLICTNSQLTFANNTIDNFNGNVSYLWDINGVIVSNQRDLLYSFTSGGNKEIKLVASIPGCSSEFVQTIPNVGEGPLVNFAISGKCAGEQVSFTNQSSGEIAGYEWDLGGTASTEINPVVRFNDSGGYTARLQATGTNGCVSQTERPFTVYSTPKADFSLALPPFSCSGSPAQFTDNTPVPTDSNLAQWTWNFGTGPTGISSLQNPAFTYPAPGTYNVALTVSTDQGCTDRLEKSVTILPSPTIDFANAAACRNQPTQFTAATTANIKSYQWTIGSNTYTLANPTHVFGAPGSTNVSLRVVAQNDCVATVSKAVVVPAELTPDFTVANACAGQTSALTNSTLAPNDPVQHVQWLINNQPFQGSAVNTQFSQAGSFPVRMQITAQSGCTYVLNRNLVVNPTPTAGFSVSDDAGPAPFRVLFTNSSQGATTYLWRFNDAAGSTNTSVNPEFVFNSLGSYGVDLIATNAFNCADRVTQQVRVITPLPDMELLDFRVVQDPATKLLVNQVDIKNNSNYTIRETPVLLNVGVGLAFREVVRAEWRPGSVRTVTLQNQLQPGQPLSFACAELALPGDLLADNNKICVPLSEFTVWLAAYPNPADDFLTVPLIAAKQGLITIQLLHSTGALVYEKTVDQRDTGLREWTLPVNNLTNGLYTLIVRTQDDERTAQILINR